MKTGYFIALLTVLLSFSACSKPDLYDYRLTEQEKALIPFKGNEKLLFVSNKGNSMLFRGMGYEDRIYPESLGSSSNAFELREYLTLNFKNEDNRIGYIVGSHNFFWILVSIQKKSWVTGWPIKDMINGKNVDLDSLPVSGKTYYNVYICPSTSNEGDVCEFYYNKDFGLFRWVSLADTTVWDLKEVIP